MIYHNSKKYIELKFRCDKSLTSFLELVNQNKLAQKKISISKVLKETDARPYNLTKYAWYHTGEKPSK